MDNFIVIEGSVYCDTRLNSTDIIVYGIISCLTNNNKGYCYATNDYIAKKRGLSERQIYRSISKLKSLNYIIVDRQNKKRVLKTYLSQKIKERNSSNKLNIFHYDWLNDDDD